MYRSIAKRLPLSVGVVIAAMMLTQWVYHVYPPAFTGDACPGSTMNGMAVVCGVFPFGVFIPLFGLAIAAGILLPPIRRELSHTVKATDR